MPRSLRFCCGAIFLLGAILICSLAEAQKALAPLTEGQIILLLQGSVRPQRVGQLAQQRGITFEVTPAVVSDLRDAGATPELIEILREVSSRPVPAPPPPPPQPEAPAALEAPTTHLERPGGLNAQMVIGATEEGKNAQAQHDQTILDRLQQNFIKTLADYAQRHGFAYILDDSTTPVYYLAPPSDLTATMTQVYAFPQSTAGVAALSPEVDLSSKPHEVRVINLNAVLAGTAEGKEAFASLQKKYQPRKEMLDRQQQEIQTLQDQLTKGLTTLSDGERRRLNQELEDKQKLLKKAMEDAQSEFTNDQNELAQRLGKKAVKLIGEYARQNGWALVTDDAQISVYYASQDLDITGEILRLYDAGDRGLPSEILTAPQRSSSAHATRFLNMQEALVSTAEGKAAAASLTQKFQPRQQELQRLQQEIQSEQDQLSMQAATLSDDEQHRLSRDIENKQKLLKRSAEDAQSDFNEDRDAVINRIGQKMMKLIGEYAQQNGMALVLDGQQVSLYYAAPGLDITTEITRRYDAAYPAQ
jgi:outer membrane protein